VDELRSFREFGTTTLESVTEVESEAGETLRVPTFVNEYWTSAQRAAARLHEISYRACFKPQLPRFFIERFTSPGDVVYDPFMGRGTTLIEAALLGRVPVGCDVNPLSTLLVRPRLHPPTLEEVRRRLAEIDFEASTEMREDLLVFYHPETLRAITSLREYLIRRRKKGDYDKVDDWISLVALNRLTGHSAGFFSVYTLPPNQATSIKRQTIINEQRGQIPPRRDVAAIILKKSKSLLSDVTPGVRKTLEGVSGRAQLVTSQCSSTPAINKGSVDLVVTSPPFLAVVQYAADNWLRCWFAGIDPDKVQITQTTRLEVWKEAMTASLAELRRVLRPGGHIAFEVGEVAQGAVKLELATLQCGVAAGLQPELIVINAQAFTKTANCWGVDNNSRGTNTNRIVVFTRG
jgi:hypothetical protein